MNQDQQIRDLETELEKVNKVCAMREGIIIARDITISEQTLKIRQLESEKAELQAILDGLAEEGDF